jgi:hypothetical protein
MHGGVNHRVDCQPFRLPIVHTVVARTALHRGDPPTARTHLARAARLRPRDILQLRPDLGVLPTQVEELWCGWTWPAGRLPGCRH